jgi:hypothetical protein
LAERIIVDEVNGLLIVSWRAKTVVHADAAEFVGRRGLEMPDINIDSKDEVESCAVDACLAPTIRKWE